VENKHVQKFILKDLNSKTSRSKICKEATISNGFAIWGVGAFGNKKKKVKKIIIIFKWYIEKWGKLLCSVFE
jgi:hypothetical protein